MKRFLVLLGTSCCLLVAQSPTAVTLDQAVQEALASNLDLAAARYDISVAEARQITAKLRPNPVMTVSGDHLDLLGTGYDNTNNAGPNEYAYRTDFVLERGGKRAARMEVAAASTKVAELGFRDAMRRLIYDVESAFVDVQAAKENVALAEDNLRSLNSIVSVNTERLRTGDLAAVELDRSQVAAMQYQTAVRLAALQLQQAKNKLRLLMAKPDLADDYEVSGPIRREPQPLALADIRTRALAQRPDILEARQTQARNQADLRLQLAQGKIDYTAGMEYRRQQAPSGTGNSLGFFFSFPLPVFNRNQGEIARADREIAQAAAQLRASEARIGGEAVSAWQQYATSRSLLEDIEQRMLSKARDVRQTTEYSYRRGEASLVEFLDAQRAFNDVMQNYNEARANYARSLYLIDSVTASPAPAAGTIAQR
jgi:cobalt-zinc-cadmium efflux system outer membrane protein